MYSSPGHVKHVSWLHVKLHHHFSSIVRLQVVTRVPCQLLLLIRGVCWRPNLKGHLEKCDIYRNPCLMNFPVFFPLQLQQKGVNIVPVGSKALDRLKLTHCSGCYTFSRVNHVRHVGTVVSLPVCLAESGRHWRRPYTGSGPVVWRTVSKLFKK